MSREPGSLCPSGNRPRGFGPTGDGPAPVIGVGLRRARFVAVVVLLAVAMVVGMIDPLGLPPIASALAPAFPAASLSAASASAASAASASTSPGSLSLTYQSPWVSPGQPFDIKLRAGSGAPAVADLGVSVAVYGCLSSVSSFDQAATSSSPSGTPISRTASPLPWSGLHPDATGVDLSLGVDATGSSSSTISPGHPVIGLRSAGTSCQAGVFPVRLQLVNTTSNTTVASLTTFLVYVTMPAAQKLRFAMVVPVSTSVGPSSHPSAAQLLTTPSSALTRPAVDALAGINQLVAALSTGAGATVPVTITANAQTLQSLTSGGHPSTVSALAGLSATPAVHQFALSPYAPVDASALVDAGLGSELLTQLNRGDQVLTRDDGINLSATPPAPGGSSPWITNDGLDDNTLGQLAATGYNQLILPAADVMSSPVNGSGAEPFTINSSHGSSFTAITSNADLSDRFTADPGDPVLAAAQLMGELAQIYFEYPNLSTARAVVAVPPTGWTANPTLITTLVADLANNPITQTVTAQGLFQALPSPAPCRSGCRLTSSSGASGSSVGTGLPVSAIRNQRDRIAGLTSSISPSSPVALTLPLQFGDLVLASESENLKSSQQASVLRNTDAAINAQFDQISVSGDQAVTLTSRNGLIPVSIASRAPYPVTGTLILTSDELLFSNGTRRLSRPATLTTSTNNFYINVEARTSGESKLEITFRSPTGGVVITSGVISVRSTATSVVGVVLSLGAVVVLLAWWVRTGIRRRKRQGIEDAAAPS